MCEKAIVSFNVCRTYKEKKTRGTFQEKNLKKQVK